MKNTREKVKILLIGHNSSQVSGSSLSFKQLVEDLGNSEHVLIDVINTARPLHLTSSWVANLNTALRVTVAVVLKLKRMDVVSFHASQPAMMMYGPILYLLTRIYRKPLVLRLFGGALEQEYQALSSLGRFIFDRTILKAELLLLQTKHLANYFSQRGGHSVRWFSNYRKMSEIQLNREDYISGCWRFVFLGRIVEEKGIEVILESLPHVNAGISIDIYGSVNGAYTVEEINTRGRGIVIYKGILNFEQVLDVLCNYDALILPTHYPGEGYPGVVLEAYSRGLPVIATQWRSIPEIVDSSTGILIPIRNSRALAEAMNKLNTDNELYRQLRHGVNDKRMEFNDRVWVERFIEWCDDLVNGRA